MKNLAINKSYGEFINKAVGDKYNYALSIVSHDLKSPLTAIQGISNLLLVKLNDQGSEAIMIEMIKQIIGACDNMQALVGDINHMVKIEAGQEKVEPYWVVNLERELKEAIAIFAFQAKFNKINISLNVKTALPVVCWDIVRLRNHVFNNIISNALQFTPEGGAITVSVTAYSKHIELRIEDTGPGIPAGEEENVFCRFGQLKMKSSRVFSGSGLGLYNARMFTKNHGGEISIDTSYTKGASFIIKLPLDAGTDPVN